LLVTTRLKVVFGSLNELTDELEATANALEEHLGEIDQALARISESWTGQASDNFHRCFSEWQATSRDLHGTLRGLHRLTLTAHGNYSEAESANLRMWGAR
jgi:WXG100 family type VII secretion target